MNRRCPRTTLDVFRTSLVMVLLCGALVGCGASSQDSIPTDVLKAAGHTTQLGDGRFMSKVTVIKPNKDCLHINDPSSNQILCLDDDLNVLHTIGSAGEGPGEFTYIRHFVVQNDKLFAYDEGRRRIHVFSMKGVYERTIALPSNIFGGFAVDPEENLYITAHPSDFPIIKLDSQGNVVQQFGKNLGTTDSEVQNRQRSARFLVMTPDQKLITIGAKIPVIEKYSLDGDLLRSLDLSRHPLFEPRLAYADEKYAVEKIPNKTVMVVNRIELIDKTLYVLIITGVPKKDLRVNTLLAMNIETLEVEHIYKLSDDKGNPLLWVDAFGSTTGGDLLVFHGSEGIFYRYTNPFPI